MSYSTFIHSGLVNPSKPNLVKKTTNSIDTVTMDISLLMKLLKENVKSDDEMNNLLTNIINLKDKEVLTINDYDKIVLRNRSQNLELETIKKLAGI